MTREGVEASGAARGSMKGAEAGAEAAASAEGASSAEAAAVADSTPELLVGLAALAPWLGNEPSPSASCCLQLHAPIGPSPCEGKRKGEHTGSAGGAELSWARRTREAEPESQLSGATRLGRQRRSQIKQSSDEV